MTRFNDTATDMSTMRDRLLPSPGNASAGSGARSQHRLNVGDNERAVSVVAGAIAVLMGLSRQSLPGLLCAGVGGALVYRGLTGHCHAYAALGIDTSDDPSQSDTEKNISNGVEVSTSFLFTGKTPEDLYSYWRDFTNLPRIMSHLQSVTSSEGGKSHWVAKAPALVGGKVEWDAELTRDEPNRAIAWRSLPGSQVDTAGEVRFERALGDRGTMITVEMKYRPPAGRLGHWIAKIFGEAPTHTMREDLRQFKQMMEVGEIPTIEGQPRGTCAGFGMRSPSSRS